MKRAEEYRKRAEEAEARAAAASDPSAKQAYLRSPSSGDTWPNMQSIWNANAKAASVGGLFLFQKALHRIDHLDHLISVLHPLDIEGAADLSRPEVHRER